jgi:Cu-processing system permease protein
MKTILIAKYILAEAFSRKMIVVLIGAIVLGLIGLSLALDLEVVEGSLAAIKLFGKGMENGNTRVDIVMFHIFQSVSLLIFHAGIVVGIISTSALAIEVLSAGRVELLLSLPVRRAEILLGTFLGVVLITGFGLALALGGLSGVLFLKANYFSAGPIIATVMGLLGFMCVYSWMLVVSITTQSVPLTQASGFLIYLLCNLSGTREKIMSVFPPGWKRSLVDYFFLPFPRFSELSTWAAQAAGGQWHFSDCPVDLIFGAMTFSAAGIILALALFSRKDY